MAGNVLSLKDRVNFEAPKVMSGPQVHCLKKEVLAALQEKVRLVVIDFSKVAYIDLHGLVLFKDMCEIIRTCGSRAYAFKLQPDMRDLLAEADLLDEAANKTKGGYMIKTA